MAGFELRRLAGRGRDISSMGSESSMMTFQRVAKYISAEPFRPFRISMASGKVFEIRHPEMVQVGRTTMRIFTYLDDDEEQSKEREHEISLLLVESIEPLDLKSTAGNN